MGALSYNRSFLCRGKSNETGEWVYGNYVEMVIDSRKYHYIYPYPQNANSGNHAYTPQPVECKEESIGRFTGSYDYNGKSLFEGDVVELPNEIRGEICFELGAWGVSVHSIYRETYDTIDWEELEKYVPEYRSSCFMYADYFISFPEMYESFCPEDEMDNRMSFLCCIGDDPKAEEVTETEEIKERLKEFREAWNS